MAAQNSQSRRECQRDGEPFSCWWARGASPHPSRSGLLPAVEVTACLCTCVLQGGFHFVTSCNFDALH